MGGSYRYVTGKLKWKESCHAGGDPGWVGLDSEDIPGPRVIGRKSDYKFAVIIDEYGDGSSSSWMERKK